MLNNKKKRIIKRNLKRVAIVGVPLAILCTITYASITSLSHASDSTNAFEHYYDDPSYTGSSSEYDNTNEKSGETGVGNSSDDALEVITGHDNVVLDTKPESITVLVNKELRLPSDYIPGDLVVPDVSFSFNYYDEKKLMRQEAADALEKLFEAAKAQNIILNGVSAYRSYERQYDIFTDNVKNRGLEHTTKYSATPGYSEHQTGLAIDVSSDSVNNRLDEIFGDSTEGKWLAENAYLYGFVIRYPEDKTKITGYSYEPWHIRYVGKPLAKYLYENNLCLEEYFNFEPSMDYSDQISYDNLEEYGIDLADVTKPTNPPTQAPTQAPTQKPDKNTGDDKDTADDTKDTTDDPVKEPTGKGDEDTSDNTEDDNTKDGDDGNVTPTKPPKGHGNTPTPTPTETVTPTPDPDDEEIPLTTDETSVDTP